MFSIDKSKTLKAASKIPLRYVGDVDANLEDVMREEKQFVTKSYGRNQLSSSENRCTISKSLNPPSFPPAPRVFIFLSKLPAFGNTFSTISPQRSTG